MIASGRSVRRPFDDPNLHSEFGRRVWVRGVHYFEQGRVAGLHATPDGTWEARVQGTRARPYAVWLDVVQDGGRLWLDGGCTCPADPPCKHQAAVLCALRATTVPRVGSGQAPADVRVRDDLQALRRWLMQAQSDQSPTPAAADPTSHRLLYILSLTDGQGQPSQLVVQPHGAKVRKGGGLQRSRPFDLEGGLRPDVRPTPWVTDHDRLLWLGALRLSLGKRSGRAGAIAVPRSGPGTALFRELVTTGRCHFHDSQSPALRFGSTLRGSLQWTTGDDGRQRLVVFGRNSETEDPRPLSIVLPLSPPYYVDPARGVVGPVLLPMSDTVATAIAELPALAPESVAALPPSLRAALQSAGVPTPIARPLRVLDEPCRPHLWIGVPGPVPQDAHPLHHAAARLQLHYGPITLPLRVEPDDTARVVRRVTDGVVVEVHRDIDAEEAYAARLQDAQLDPRIVDDEVLFCAENPGAWLPLMTVTLPALRQQGWTVEVDDSFPFDVVAPDGWYLDLEPAQSDWFSLAVGVEIDGARINLLPAVVDAIRSGRLVRAQLVLDGDPMPLPLPDGRWVAVSRQRLATIVDTLVELFDERLDGGRLPIAAADSARLLALQDVTWHGAKNLRRLAEQLGRQEPLPRVKSPRGLGGELREYQARGLDWLGFLRAHGFGGVLADDMGLGKTIQTLAHLLVEKRARRLDRPCLVVAPRSVLPNWARECQRFAPALRCGIYHGSGRAPLLTGKLPDVVITTYALLQRDEALREHQWHVVVLDEAQAIKNPRAKVTQAAFELSARQRLCLSGTPMENNLEELWSLFQFAVPGLLGSLQSFSRRYRRPIEREADANRLAGLSARIAPFMLRRTKSQVLTELPPKTEVLVTIPIDRRQRDLYEAVRLTMEKRVRDALSQRGLAKSHIIVLDALLKLRQVCCHPALVKTEAARQARAASAKTERLLELVAELTAEGRKTLIFSQFTSMLDIIAPALSDLGIEHQSITGKTRMRQQIVDKFQGGATPVLLISLKAGGVGINLTAADTVIHYDPWWNPAVEAQATDRTHRIGQQRPVTVYKLVCEGTVEERILALQDRKRALTDALQRDAERRGDEGMRLGVEEIAMLLSPASD